MFHAEVNINGKNLADEGELEVALAHRDELIHIICNKEEKGLDIEFSEKRDAFIGWTDLDAEEVYYFDNGSGNTESVPLLINFCPEERKMCYDFEVVKDIIRYFIETGERNPKYSWIADEM